GPRGAGRAAARDAGATGPGGSEVTMLMRWVALVLTAAALLAGGVLEVALGQTPPIEGMDRLSPEERAVAQRNLERWQKMTPEARQNVPDRYRQWRPP